MTQQFQLVCKQCGQTLVVEPRHAGNHIKCDVCAASIEVPKLRDLKQLEPVQISAATAVQRTWGPLSGGLFVFGVLLLAIAVGSNVFLHKRLREIQAYTEQPVIENSDLNSLDGQSLSQTWQLWNDLIEITDVSLRNEPKFLQARAAQERWNYWAKFFYGVATVGIFCAILAFFARPKVTSAEI